MKMKRLKYVYHICMNNCMKGSVGKGKVRVAAVTVKIKKSVQKKIQIWFIYDYDVMFKDVVENVWFKKGRKISQIKIE